MVLDRCMLRPALVPSPLRQNGFGGGVLGRREHRRQIYRKQDFVSASPYRIEVLEFDPMLWVTWGRVNGVSHLDPSRSSVLHG